MKKEKKRIAVRLAAGFLGLYLVMTVLMIGLQWNNYRELNSGDEELQQDNSWIYMYQIHNGNDNLTGQAVKYAFYIVESAWISRQIIENGEVGHPEHGKGLSDRYLLMDGRVAAKYSNIVLSDWNFLPGESHLNKLLMWNLDEDLTREELNQVAGFVAKMYEESYLSYQERKNQGTAQDMSAADGRPDIKEYEAYMQIAVNQKNGRTVPKPAALHIVHTEDGHSKTVFLWENKKLEEGDRIIPQKQNIDIQMPYLAYGYEEWTKWMDSPLSSALDEKSGMVEEWDYDVQTVTEMEGTLHIQKKTSAITSLGQPEYILVGYDSYYPLRYAVYNLRYVLAGAFLFGIVSMLVLYRGLCGIYDKQQAMEQSRRDFTRGMAHELKTPLAIIRNFTEILKEDLVPDKKEYYLDTIITETENMDKLVVRMLALSKMDANQYVLQPEEVRVDELLEKELMRIADRMKGKELRIETDLEPAILICDRQLLLDMLRNLLDNAVSYTGEGGWIRLTLTREGFTVENETDSILQNELENIWKMFYRRNTERERDGEHTGLGLYLVKRYAELMGFACKAVNIPDGVCFSIDFTSSSRQ